MNWRIALAPALVFLVLSCTLDYNEENLASELSEDTPDTVLYDVTHTIVSDSTPRFVVRAERAETFGDRSRQYLDGIAFTELAADGSVITEGSADYAEYQTDTENIEITGSVRFYSSEQDAFLSAQVLFWNSDERRLTSEPEEPVFLRRGDGTSVRGRGFVAEMGRSIIRFEDGVSGTIIEQTDE
jgi:LPS export ABC transporter protein LptC